MPTRRKFLESAAVVSAAPLVPGVVFANGARRAAPMGTIYDSRSRDARLFGSRAERWGVPAVGIEGDITDFWQDELRGHWNSTRIAVAGVTERPALFLLEQLSWDYGLRVVYHAEHWSNDSNSVSHRVVRTMLPNLAGQLEAAGATWPSALADLMLTAPEQMSSTDVSPSGAAMAARLAEPAMLHSWIIAPRTTAFFT